MIKVWILEMGYEWILWVLDVLFVCLGLDYFDFYLIYMFFGDYYGVWWVMEKFYVKGCVWVIGVCNFELDRLLDLCYNVNVILVVNQIEVYFYIL